MFSNIVVFVCALFGLNTVEAEPAKRIPTVTVPEDEIVIVNFIPENLNN